MATAPYGVRLLVGAAVTVVEEARKLPQTIVMYPMTVVSQAAHLFMKVQQDVAELAIRGDAALDSLFPPKDEQPQWATFDEDAPESVSGAPESVSGAPESGAGEPQREGRFALYSSGGPDPQPPREPVAPPAVDQPPAVVADLEYDTLTLAQLRARLPSLSVPELDALLAYEESARARAPFQTLLANRITRASAK